MVINLIIFASDARYHPAASRLQRQAIDSGWFTNIYIYGLDKRLKGFTPSCVKDGFAHEVPRGFGLWSWKPEFIVYCMDNIIKRDEYIVYLDVGCEINSRGGLFFELFLEKAQQGLVVATNTSKFDFFWSSRTLIRRLKPSFWSLFSYQYQAGILIFRNSHTVRAFMSDSMTFCLASDYELLRDKSVCEGWFGENRHDQSVFSLLAKKRNIGYTMGYSLDYKVMVSSEFMAAFPFWANRNLSSKSIRINDGLAASNSLYAMVRFFVLRIIAKFSA